MPGDVGTRSSWWIAGVVLAGSCYLAARQEAAVGLLRRAEWNWAEMAVYGGVCALGMAAVAGMQRVGWLPARGDRDCRAMLQTALETAQLPSGARPDAWHRLVRQEADEARQGRRLAAGLMGLVAVLVAVAAVVANDNAWTLWALAVALGAFVVVPVRALRRREERARALLARLDSR